MNKTEIKKIFNKNGFAILKNFVPKKIIDEIKRETEKLIKNKLIKNQKRDLNYLKTGQLSSVHNIVDYMPKYKKFGSHSKLYDVFNEIFGPYQKQWFNSSVNSVLKRKYQRGLMNEQIRNQHSPSKVSKLEVNHYIYS